MHIPLTSITPPSLQGPAGWRRTVQRHSHDPRPTRLASGKSRECQRAGEKPEQQRRAAHAQLAADGWPCDGVSSGTGAAPSAEPPRRTRHQDPLPTVDNSGTKLALAVFSPDSLTVFSLPPRQTFGGYLIVDKRVEVLGGRVSGLYESWERQGELEELQRTDATIAAGRPPFVPFSKGAVAQAKAAKAKRLVESKSGGKEAASAKDEDEKMQRAPTSVEQPEFLHEAARQDLAATRRAHLGITEEAIARAARQQKAPPPRRRGRRRFGGDDDDDADAPQTRTLDEYLQDTQSKPVKEKPTEEVRSAAASAANAAQLNVSHEAAEKQLTGMGFSVSSVRLALQAANNQVESALELLLAGMVESGPSPAKGGGASPPKSGGVREAAPLPSRGRGRFRDGGTDPAHVGETPLPSRGRGRSRGGGDRAEAVGTAQHHRHNDVRAASSHFESTTLPTRGRGRGRGRGESYNEPPPMALAKEDSARAPEPRLESSSRAQSSPSRGRGRGRGRDPGPVDATAAITAAVSNFRLDDVPAATAPTSTTLPSRSRGRGRGRGGVVGGGAATAARSDNNTHSSNTGTLSAADGGENRGRGRGRGRGAGYVATSAPSERPAPAPERPSREAPRRPEQALYTPKPRRPTEN